MTTRAPVLEPKLASLLAAVGERAFFDEYWERRHLSAPGTPERLESLRESLGGFGVSDLLALRTGDVIVGPEAVGLAQRGLRIRNLDDAFEFYAAGRTLTFNLDARHAAVRPWYEAFTGTLAPAPNRSVITVFCAPPGHGTPLHFDQYDVFNVALSGTKHWRIGRERAVQAPLHDWQIDRPVPVELRGYWPGQRDLGGDLQDVAMTPGDMLYLPRGYFHETTAGDEPTIGMSFVVDVQSTFELINTALRVMMFQNDGLRASANDLWHSRRGRAAVTSVAEGLATAQRLLASLTPADLAPPDVAPVIDATTQLRRSPLGVRYDEADTTLLRRVDQPDAAEVDPRDAKVLDWIDERHGIFNAGDLFEAFKAEYGHDALCDFAALLIEIGYLTRADHEARRSCAV